MKNALGVSLGICAAVYTYLALGIISVIGATAIWGGFIAWGSYFTVGKDALSKNISANVFGAVLAGIAVILYGLINAYVGAEISWGYCSWYNCLGINNCSITRKCSS